MIYRPVMLFSVLLTGCSEQSVSKHNAIPVALITSHSDGDTVADGEVLLIGQGSDPDDDADELEARWEQDGVVVCDYATPDATGATSCDLDLLEGTTEVRLLVRDPDNAIGVDHIVLSVDATAAPTAAITSPADGERLYTDILVTFSGTIADAEDDPTDLAVAWTSSEETLDFDSTIDTDGTVTGFAHLGEGEHALTLQVTDTHGKTGSASVVVQVGPPNSSPTCAITSPEDDDLLLPGDSVTLTGTASDADQDADELTAAWVSDRDGPLGEVHPTTSGEIVLGIDGLTPDVHVLTLTVTDELGENCTDVVVVSAGSEPGIAINAPTDGSVLPEGEATELQATVNDAEDPATALSVTWTSSIDGSIGTTSSDAAGFSSIDATLALGDHTLTATVTDTHGLTASDTVNIHIASRPTILITAPADGSVLASGSATNLQATANDAEDPATDLSVEWTSSIDATLGSTTPDAAGLSTITISSALSLGTHTLTATVTDTDGLTGSDSVTIAVASVPTVLITAPADGSVLPHDEAVDLNANAIDAEDPATDLDIAWTSSIDGSLGTTSPDATGLASISSTLSLGVHTLTATVTDTDGLTGSDSVTITMDDVPQVTGVSITPAPPYAGDTLICSWTFIDVSGPDLSTVEWAIDGIPAGSATPFTGSFVRDDVVTCTVTPFDGSLTGTPQSATTTVANSVPSIVSATITPNPATVVDTLSCGWTGYTDADADTDESRIEWEVGTTAMGSTPTLAGSFVRGDTVRCTVTPSDGTDDGPSVSDELIIGNTPPEILSLDLGPTGATTDTTLSTTVTTTDADGDTVDLSYLWRVDGASIAATDSSLSGVAWFDRDQTVQVEATPHDTIDGGPTVASVVITIANTPPTAPGLAFEPSEPVEGEDDVVCFIDTESVDPDADSVTYTFVWERDGATWTGTTDTTHHTGDTIVAADTTADEVWTCTATPDDGTDEGEASTIEVTIDNAQTRVFVTRDGHNGDHGGPPGADVYCTDAAAAAGLSGTWTAFLSGGSHTAITRISEGPYHRLDGALIATDKADLTDGSINVTISIDEYGSTGIDTWVFTGSTAAGTVSGPATASGGNCVGWTHGCGVCGSPMDHWYAHSGDSGKSDAGWVVGSNLFCSYPARIYCFED